MKFLRVGGHRGAGCTDSDFVQAYAGPKPAENTLESIQTAFQQGVDYVEIDVVSTRDGHIVVTHSDRLADHVFQPTPHQYVGDISWTELQTLGVGRRGNGKIPLLRDVLSFLSHLPPMQHSTDFRLNVELKDVKGAGNPRDEIYIQEFIRRVVVEVKNSQMPLSSIVFSSFATADLVFLHDHCPAARLAQLFEANRETEADIYPLRGNAGARYMHYSPRAVEAIQKQVPLEFIHPEASDVTVDMMKHANDHGVQINAWTWRERPPSADPALLRQLIADMVEAHQSIGFLTDYPAEILALQRDQA